MRKNSLLGACAVAVLMLAATTPAAASVVNFDNLPRSDITFLSDGYHGLDWDGSNNDHSWIVSSVGRGWFSGVEAHSGSNFAWSNAGSALTMAAPASFSLYGFWARHGIDTLSSLAVIGYSDGIEVAKKSFALNGTYRYITLNFSGIDSVRITGAGNTLIDDISVSTIAEPDAYALFLAGLTMLAVRRKALQPGFS